MDVDVQRLHKNGINPSPAVNGIQTTITTSSDPNKVTSPIMSNAALTGKWKIVLDSTFNHVSNATYSQDFINKYNGPVTDFFEFTNDGKFYRHQNNTIDTANYTVDADSINVNGSYWRITYTTTKLTPNSLILRSWFIGTMGAIYNTLVLKKE